MHDVEMGRFILSWLAGCAVLGCSADFDGIPITGRIRQYDYTFDIATGHATAGVVVAEPGDCFAASFELPAAGVATWNGSLRAVGVEVRDDHELPGVERGHIADAFGNRIELLAGPSRQQP